MFIWSSIKAPTSRLTLSTVPDGLRWPTLRRWCNRLCRPRAAAHV